MPLPDKRVTIDDIVAEVRDGMTVGIGGWGSRRKPMALVRALLPLVGARTSRSSRTAAPTSACSAAAGKVPQGRLRVRVARLDRARAALPQRARRPARSARTELDEGMFLLGLQAAAWRVPFLPTRVGLGSDVMRAQPRRCARCARRTPTARSSSPCPRSTLDVALVHMHRGDQGGNGQYLERRPVLRRPDVHGRDSAGS